MEDAQLHHLRHNLRRPLFSCLIVGLVTLGACASEPHPPTMELDFLAARPSVFQPQFGANGEGELFVAWRERADDGSDLYLVPGRPTGRLIRPEGVTWETVVDDLPPWSTSAAIIADRLLLLGSESGSARFEVRQLGS